MKFEKPTSFMGVPIEGAYEKAIKDQEESARNKTPESKPIIPNPSNASPEDGFVYIPSIGLYLAKEKTLKGLNWEKTHEELANQNTFMPTISQFKEFVKYLRSNPSGTKDATGQEISSILDEILTVRNPWRSEWLDAKFEVVDKTLGMFGGKTLIHYDHRFSNGSLQAGKSEPLDDYLTSDKKPGISLDDWLENANKYGLPKPDVKEGELYYWHPRNGTVAGFVADSGGAGLYCSEGPSVRDGVLGVRAAKILGGNK